MLITVPMLIVLLISIAAIVLFVTEWVSADVTALSVMVALMLTGILTPAEGLSGFSNVATITVFALLVLSIGLQSTGVVNYLGEVLEKFTGKSEFKIFFFTTVIVGFLSAFMNNTAVVAIFLPVVSRLAEFAKVSVSRFLMPLSFAAMIGGATTVIGTSTNILVAGIYEEYSGESFLLFEFSLLGLIFFIVFLLFMFLVGRRMIPSRKPVSGKLTTAYKVKDYLAKVVVPKGSDLLDKRIEETELFNRYQIDILEINRGEEKVWLPNQIEILREGDDLVLKADRDDLIEMQIRKQIKIRTNQTLDEEELTSEEALLFEAVIGQNSFLIGKKFEEIDFHQMFRAVPLAIRRSGIPLTNLDEVFVQFGDVLLLEARRRYVEVFHKSKDFIVLQKLKKKNIRYRKMKRASLIVLAVILLAAFGILPIVVASLLGCILLFVTGCVSMRYTYSKMDWRIFFLLAGILPLGLAVQKTGVDGLLAGLILDFCGDSSPRIIIALLFLITTLLTSFMSNNATAVLIAPIAITLGEQLHLDPKPFLITVMFAASTSFLTPIGYQTNTLVYSAGQYTFMDFFKVGGILTLIVWVLATILIPLFYF